MAWQQFTAVLGLRTVDAKLYSVERKAAILYRDHKVVVQVGAAEELAQEAVRAELQTREQLSAL